MPLLLAACAAGGGAHGSNSPIALQSVPDSGAFEIAGDPHGPEGAPWTFRGTVASVRYELTGILLAMTNAGRER